MRGASALGRLLAKYPLANVRVLVVWLPVIESDKGPPADRVRIPLQDPRVIEYWDPGRWASPKMLERAALMVRARGDEPDFGPGAIAWDLILLYPTGGVWTDPFPQPAWWSGPVVDVLEPVEKLLAARQSEDPS